jgi:hypothetical protein
MIRASATVMRAESNAAATTMGGSDATPKVERKSASRVAFPAIWKAIITMPATAAAAAARLSAE